MQNGNNDTNFGAPVDGFREYADERGHVMYTLRNDAVGPNAQNPNYHATLQQVIAGLYKNDERDEEEDAETEDRPVEEAAAAHQTTGDRDDEREEEEASKDEREEEEEASDNERVEAVFFEANTDKDWTKTTIHDVFPFFEPADGMSRILWMCLASLVHHRDKVLSFELDHIARTSISIFQDPSKMELAINSVKVIHAWDSNRHLTGIPPHVKELVDLHELKVEQLQLAATIYEKVMNGLTEYFLCPANRRRRNDQSSDEGDDCKCVPRKC
jgi:hypothetical protein